jgi:hypothetical protein
MIRNNFILFVTQNVPNRTLPGLIEIKVVGQGRLLVIPVVLLGTSDRLRRGTRPYRNI